MIDALSFIQYDAKMRYKLFSRAFLDLENKERMVHGGHARQTVRPSRRLGL